MSEQLKSLDQETLGDIVTICESRVSQVANDNIAYLRRPHSTISIGDYRHPGQPKTEDMPVGDFEIFVTEWLEEGHQGYGPNAVANYKVFTGGPEIRVRRLIELNETNGDPREETLERPDVVIYRSTYVDSDPEFELIKQAIEGIPNSNMALNTSAELKFEAALRYFGGDPEEAALGLHKVELSELQELRSLLLNSEPTTDPYFED